MFKIFNFTRFAILTSILLVVFSVKYSFSQQQDQNTPASADQENTVKPESGTPGTIDQSSTIVNDEQKVYDKDGYDQNGYDKNGYDRNGFNRNGYDKNGNDKAGNQKSTITGNQDNGEGVNGTVGKTPQIHDGEKK